MEQKILITTREAAERLGIGRTVLYRYLGTGALPIVRIGRSVRVHVKDVESFAESLRVGRTGGR